MARKMKKVDNENRTL